MWRSSRPRRRAAPPSRSHLAPTGLACAPRFVGTYSRGGSHGGRLGLGDRAAAWRSSRRLSQLHQIEGAGSIDDYLTLLNAIVDICILEQVAEHSNRCAGLRRLAQNKLVEVEFAVLLLRRSIEACRTPSTSPPCPLSAIRAVRLEVCPPVASTSFAVLDIFFPIIPTSLTPPP